jgi:hypothetical protein
LKLIYKFRLFFPVTFERRQCGAFVNKDVVI